MRSKSIPQKLSLVAVLTQVLGCPQPGDVTMLDTTSSTSNSNSESLADVPSDTSTVVAHDDNAWVCDPVGAHPEQGELLNAALDDRVEVVEKEPQHPENPGPLELP